MRRLLNRAGGLVAAFVLGFWAAHSTNFGAGAAPVDAGAIVMRPAGRCGRQTSLRHCERQDSSPGPVGALS